MYFSEDLILLYFCSKFVYDGFFEILNAVLWLMFIGFIFAGSRDEYRGKEHLDPEGEVNSTLRNTFAKVLEKTSMGF